MHTGVLLYVLAACLGIAVAEISMRHAHWSGRSLVSRALFDAIAALACICLTVRYGASATLAEMLVIASAMIVLCATDIASRVIPNACVAVIIAARIGYLVYMDSVTGRGLFVMLGWSLFDALVVAVIVSLLGALTKVVTHQSAIGAGDVKLLFASGMCFGVRQCIVALLVACVLAIIPSIVRWVSSRSFSRTIPFGPYIAIGCLVVAIIGPQISLWYEGLSLV